MVLGVPFTELLWLATAVIVAGVITGLLAGLFGVGGGAVIVPVLYEVFRLLGVPDEVRMQLCIGTSINHCADDTTLLSRASRKGSGDPGHHSHLGSTGRAWRGMRGSHCRFRAVRSIQDRVHHPCHLHREQILVGG